MQNIFCLQKILNFLKVIFAPLDIVTFLFNNSLLAGLRNHNSVSSDLSVFSKGIYLFYEDLRTFALFSESTNMKNILY